MMIFIYLSSYGVGRSAAFSSPVRWRGNIQHRSLQKQTKLFIFANYYLSDVWRFRTLYI